MKKVKYPVPENFVLSFKKLSGNVVLVTCVMILTGLGACTQKESAKRDSVPENETGEIVQKVDLLGLQADKVNQLVTSFYHDLYFSKDPNNQITKLALLSVNKVPLSYVDSLKTEICLSGIANLENAINERENMIAKLEKKVRRYTEKGNINMRDEAKLGIEKYKTRNDIQQEELKDLKKRLELLRTGTRLESADSLSFYDVQFGMQVMINKFLMSDTSSLIIRNDHYIEDMLKDGPWQAINP